MTIPFLKSKQPSAPTAVPPQVEQEPDLKAKIAQLQAENAALRVDLHQTIAIQGATLERFRTTFYELPLPCFTVNAEAKVVEFNRAASAFFGIPEHHAIDQPIEAILGNDIFRNDAEGMIYMVFLGMEPQPITIDLKVQNHERPVKWFASPIKDKNGNVVGAMNTLGVIPKSEISTQN
jgi:PAS domain S-box-containing protein